MIISSIQGWLAKTIIQIIIRLAIYLQIRELQQEIKNHCRLIQQQIMAQKLKSVIVKSILEQYNLQQTKVLKIEQV
ncbi:unnamed protein product [Paramecium octaurelia]|uniref:Uncharacterized protein n=1 Tax=Paramecium octaurelia TaxID=43137 RepID=A0A8S1WQS0_PAROT|nr:unnamed protein product [Paramecium octaurelia]